MFSEQTLYGTVSAIFLLTIVYWFTGIQKIKECYNMWFTREYWTNYNIVEFLSWLAKAIIIVPGLIFGISVWWLYFFTLLTSLTLIWASNKKLLPTLVAFNTLWTWISCMILAKNLM
ncbi:MAG: hypothetical protein EBU90_07365 [Proteobacteria bacterium]|nr:hypothetical protein [Pseudomonadota bacterium]NBP13478.1 hypothetical protein [bacterium]